MQPAEAAVIGAVEAGPIRPVAIVGQSSTRPVAGARVEALDDGTVVAATTTDDGGRYELRVPWHLSDPRGSRGPAFQRARQDSYRHRGADAGYQIRPAYGHSVWLGSPARHVPAGCAVPVGPATVRERSSAGHWGSR
jgi:hypothetical protein